MSRRRPLWRTAIDVLIFLLILGSVLRGLDILNTFDLGAGNATAMDGDSLRLNGEEIRLHGIDAPELHQSCGRPQGEYPCGRYARDALATLIRGRTIACEGKDRDRYGRAVAICQDGDKVINAEMVQQGWAIAYLRHDTAYARLEAEARRQAWHLAGQVPDAGKLPGPEPPGRGGCQRVRRVGVKARPVASRHCQLHTDLQ